MEEEITYCWFLEDTAIAHYARFEYAKEDLENAPDQIEIHIGTTVTYVPKKDIHIAPFTYTGG
jgi:plastocyanin